MSKGLICSIYKHNGKSQDGIGNFSSRLNMVTLIGKDIAEVFEPSGRAPEVVLRKRGDYIFCSPPGFEEIWYMFGGTFIYTSDGRFPTNYPIPLHDRREAQEAPRDH